MSVRSVSVRTVLLAVVVALLTACGGGQGDGAGPREWRDLDLVVPSGWTVLLQRPDLLMIANEDIRTDGLDEVRAVPEDPDDNDVVAIQFQADPGTTPDGWRDLVTAGEGTIEEDRSIEVGGLPATAITYEWVSNGVPTRERAVFVPARGVYILLQPVPLQAQTTGPDVYLRHVDEFEAVLDSIEWGRPFDG